MGTDYGFFRIEGVQACKETEAFEGKGICICIRMKRLVSCFPEGAALMNKMEPNAGNSMASLILLVGEKVQFEVFQLGTMPRFTKESKEDRTTTEGKLFIKNVLVAWG